MPHVIIRRYNTFFDHQTNVQFNPVLDKSAGLYIGLAEISPEQVPYFHKNAAYEVIDDEQLAIIVSGISSASDSDSPSEATLAMAGSPCPRKSKID
jgi:hypothetical protein